MNCPRCGSMKTKRTRRKEGRGKKAVETNIIDEDCLDCGWHGHHVKEQVKPVDPEPEPTDVELEGYGGWPYP